MHNDIILHVLYYTRSSNIILRLFLSSLLESDSNTGAYYVKLNSWFHAGLFVVRFTMRISSNASSFG